MIFGIGLVIAAFSTITQRDSDPPQLRLTDNVMGIVLVLTGLVAIVVGAVGWTQTRH
jgi:uncharacterized membrane protein YidH (DUF202 family)